MTRSVTHVHPQRAHRQLHPIEPSQDKLQQREQGWNDRFFYEPPLNSNKLKDPNRLVASNPSSSAAKEQKIHQERVQYGKRGVRRKIIKSKKVNNERLLPLPNPSCESEVSTKEEKLRFKVLSIIDKRETLLYQLNALILCTPVQEVLFMPSRPAVAPAGTGGLQRIRAKGGMSLPPALSTSLGSQYNSVAGGAMTNSRDATKVAQQLATDLQLTGIQCVEAIVEWMLEAGAQAEKPPQFLWRGRDYFLKMYTDLDFAQAELQARGVNLDCFSAQNPLLIKPNQKLGRVLAAMAIINEMVAQGENLSSLTECFTNRGTDASDVQSTHEACENDVVESTLCSNPIQLTKINSQKLEQDSADHLVLRCDDDADTDEEELLPRDENGFSDNEKVLQPHERYSEDSAAVAELVNILDESLSDLMTSQQLPIAEKEMIQPCILSARSEENNNSEYDNSFEEETDRSERETPQDKTHSDHQIKSLVQDELSPCGDTEEDNQVLAKTEATSSNVTNECPDQLSPSEHKRLHAFADKFVDELRRCSSLPEDIDLQHIDISACFQWHETQDLRRSLERHKSIDELTMSHSFVLILDKLGFLSSGESLQQLLCSSVAKEIHLVTILRKECMLVVNEICAFLAEQLEQSLQRGNSLVSEVEMDEVIEYGEAAFHDLHPSYWELLMKALQLALRLHYSEAMRSSSDISYGHFISTGLSKLIKVFYPYLVNKSREELRRSWMRIVELFANKSINVEKFCMLMDSTCKSLLVSVNVLKSNAPNVHDNNDERIIPKLSIVCEREDIVQSSIDCIWLKCLSKVDAPKSFVLFPFFKSTFGEKIVDGIKVEEGEGKGPLKEWFALVGAQLVVKWKPVVIDLSFRSGHDDVRVNGNKLHGSGLSHLISPGYQVKWESSSGQTITCIVNKAVDQETFLLNESVPAASFPVQQLHVSQPRTPLFEYIQASESFWLNEQVSDSPENQRAFAFVGWLFACAILHFSNVELPIHRFLFHLLLHPQHSVSLDDLRQLDPVLHDSLTQMKHMKPSEFAAYLEFEQEDPELSVDAYIAQVVEKKIARVTWQLEAIRDGFERLIPIERLIDVDMNAGDLVSIVCGSHRSKAEDFDIAQVFRVALDPDFAQSTILKRVFWQTVNAFDSSLKRKLIKFITGVDTLPLPGTEFLRIEMPFTALTEADHERILHMLPQAHTCDNTLELPHYWRALCWKAMHDEHIENLQLEQKLLQLLTRKLRDAVEYSSGYGLDATSGTIFSPEKRPILAASIISSEQLAREESYDSLNLPALDEAVQSMDDKTPDLPRVSNKREAETIVIEQKGESEESAVTVTSIAVSELQESSYEENDFEDEETL